MAGHSQFKNIMHRKGRQDAARSKLFSSLSREITVAAKSGGPEPDNNARLRLAIQNARAQSVPKDNIERAIRKSQGGDQENYDEIRYEGYGPGGVAILVEVLSDNRNRSTSNIRSYFSKYGGALGESGSVAFAFDRVGEIVYPADIADEAGMLEIAIDVGGEDVLSDQNGHSIYCAFADLHQISDALQARLGPAQSVKPIWRPQNLVPLSGDEAASLIKLISVLEADDDVQNVFANFDIAADILDSLMAG